MTLTRPLTHLLLSLTLLTLSTTLSAATPTSNDEPARINNPAIPRTVKFADVEVSLDPVEMYERYDRELSAIAFTHGNTLLCLKRANKYFPVMEPILKKHGLPTDLLYLACIESTLSPVALSPAKAAGIWQFMPSTAKELGLEVNDDVDQRYDVVASTEAACRLLKQAYDKYGRWESVAASYNAGQGRISRELAAQGVESAYDLFLNTETSRYMFRLLAMKEIMEHPAHYGFHLLPQQLYQPVDYRVVEVDSTVTSWPQWALDHGINYLILREHNPWIRSRQLPNKQRKTYNVLIPTDDSRRRSTGRKDVFNRQWTK